MKLGAMLRQAGQDGNLPAQPTPLAPAERIDDDDEPVHRVARSDADTQDPGAGAAVPPPRLAAVRLVDEPGAAPEPRGPGARRGHQVRVDAAQPRGTPASGDRGPRRHPGVRADGAVPRRPVGVGGHGQRRRRDLHRTRRQAGPDRRPFRVERPPAPGDRAHRVQGRSPHRRVVAHVRRPPARRLPRQCDHPAAGRAGSGAHHPEVLQEEAHRRGPDRKGCLHPPDRRVPRGLRARPPQHHRLGRYRHRQDDDAEPVVGLHPRRRTHRDHRGLRRAPAPAASRHHARDPAAERRGQGRGRDPRPREELAAYAARPHRRRRVSWRRDARHVAGDEHRSRGLAVDGAREQRPRHPVPHRDDGAHGRHGPARPGHP